MAYGLRYLFQFQSRPNNGDTFQIFIEKDNYSGDVIRRALGKAPVWKRERNGHICGSSLEIYAECQVDGEFAEFYTSDPHEFRVTLYNLTTQDTIFLGYISPELYAEPDIAPPYDVQVIATDGLGELRRYFFEPIGKYRLSYILEDILSKTGLDTTWYCNNATLEAGGSHSVPAADFLDHASINIDHLAGKSYYEVLEWLLDSIHADIFQRIDPGRTHIWQFLRETDVESGSAVVAGRGNEGYDVSVVPQAFGSSRTHDWWPKGYMETEVKPACKRLLVKTDANYRDALVNGDIASDTGWGKYNAAFSDDGYYLAAGGYIQQTVSFQEAIRRRLKLSVRLRQYRPTASDPSAAGTASIQVSMSGRTYGGTGTRYLIEDGNGGYQWTTNSGSITVDLAAPQVSDTDENCEAVEIEIPLMYDGPRMYAIAESITVKLSRTSSNIPLLIRSAHLTFEEQIAGYQDIFFIGNGAREEASDVETLFIPSGSGRYNTPVEFVYGVLYNLYGNVFSIFDQVGEDYAKSCALPRLRKKGTLNVPAGTGIPPFVMRDTNGYNYIIQTLEWNLYDCEMTVEMLSLPAASVTISEQQVTEVIYKGGEAASSGSSSGGSGGGGGTGVQSVGLTMPTGFSVSGSPVTGSGTLNVTLDNTLEIPTKTKQQSWDAAAAASHTHDNKAVLDQISSSTLMLIDILMNVAHNHFNKDTLDAINLQALIAPAPKVKMFKLQSNTTSYGQDAPCLFVSHPFLSMHLEDVELCLMVYRKRNGAGGSRKTHRKGWFLACGSGHAGNAAFVTSFAAGENSMLIPLLDIRDGIAKTYCQIYNVLQATDYADWLDKVSQLSASEYHFGFSGKHNPANYKHKIHFGLAVRMVNPEFENYVEQSLPLHDDTGSIQGIPRYLYSAVAPLTARMYAEAKSGQPKGGIVFDLM